VILKEVHQKVSELALIGNESNASTVICYEVLSVGPGVVGLAVGDHCLHISAAGDKPFGGICVVREEDVILYWPNPKPE
jgi:hypothetical protein